MPAVEYLPFVQLDGMDQPVLGDVRGQFGQPGFGHHGEQRGDRVERDTVLVESGLQDREMVVVSTIKAVTDDMVVRTAPMEEKRS